WSSDVCSSDLEIERMIKEAEANADADKKRQEEAELRNEADQAVFMTEKTISDLGDNVSEEEKKQAEEAKDELKAALEKDDIEDIRTKKDKLMEIVQQMSVKMYEQAAAQAQQAQQDGGSSDDGVVDADFEEVDDDKNNK